MFTSFPLDYVFVADIQLSALLGQLLSLPVQMIIEKNNNKEEEAG